MRDSDERDLEAAARIEIEHWRAIATRALYQCCHKCRALLHEQLEQEEMRE